MKKISLILAGSCAWFLMALLPLAAKAQTIVPLPRAILLEPDLQCRRQLRAAASELAGKPLALADDAFTKNDSQVLSTAGQSAGGHMKLPTMILRLRSNSEGCVLMMDGVSKSLALKDCSCGGISVRQGG